MNFNTEVAPTDLDLTTVIEIGHEYKEVKQKDGSTKAVLKLDKAGNPIARKFVVPQYLTVKDIWSAFHSLGAERITKLGESAYDDQVDIIDAIVGDGIIKQLSTDRTVDRDAFLNLLNYLHSKLDIEAVYKQIPKF